MLSAILGEVEVSGGKTPSKPAVREVDPRKLLKVLAAAGADNRTGTVSVALFCSHWCR
ncbi:MAG: hypothetical protein ACRD21_13970 [Vicinamibacteria bacterium]